MNWNQYSTSWGSSLQQWMVICLCDFIIFHLTFPFVTSLFSIDFFHHHYQLLLFQLLLHQSLTRKSSVSGRSKDDSKLNRIVRAMEELLFQDNVIVPRRCNPFRNIISLWRTVSTRRGCTPKRLYLLIYSIYAHHGIYVFWFTASI